MSAACCEAGTGLMSTILSSQRMDLRDRPYISSLTTTGPECVSPESTWYCASRAARWEEGPIQAPVGELLRRYSAGGWG